jgi:hypothetical protein
MRTYHPIQWVEHIRWHDVLTDNRLWAAVAIVGFVALFVFLVVVGVQGGGMPTMPYYGTWPYGPIHMP